MNRKIIRRRRKQFFSFCLAMLIAMGSLESVRFWGTEDLKRTLSLDLTTYAGTGSGDPDSTPTPPTPAPEPPTPAPEPPTPTPVTPDTDSLIHVDFYKVTYMIDGKEAGEDENGGNSTATQVAGTIVTLKTPTKPGYVFDGWYDSSDFSASSKVTQFKLQSDTTLYGHFGKPITYYVNGASATVNGNPVCYMPGTAVEKLASGPSRGGLLFENWYTDEALTTPVGSPAIAATDTEAKIFYAKYMVSENAEDTAVAPTAKEYSLYQGGTLDLKTELKNLLTDSNAYTFKSMDETVVTTDENGVLSAGKTGTTEVRILKDGKYSFSTEVQVLPVKIELSKKNVDTKYSGRKKVNIKVSKITPQDGVVTFASEDEKVATVKYNADKGRCIIWIEGAGATSIFAYVNGVKTDKSVRVRVAKGTQSLEIKPKEKVIHYEGGVKRRRQYFWLNVPKVQTKITYKVIGSYAQKQIKVSKEGKVTVKQGTRKGTYKIEIKAAESKNYKSAKAYVKIRIK